MSADILVKLYQLPACPPLPPGVILRRPLPHERSTLRRWVGTHFGEGWADECDTAFCQQPPGVCLVVQDGQLMGFACFDVTARGFFGPTGVLPAARGQGLGKLLLRHSLHALREKGYAYAIIGSAGPVDFYLQNLPAMVIPDSDPGIYPPPLG